MFNPTQIVIQAFVGELKNRYGQIYGILEPAYPDIVGFVGRLALENIANSDAAYHDMNHTIMVTLVGQQISTWETYQRGRRYSTRLAPFYDFPLMPRHRLCTEGMSGRP